MYEATVTLFEAGGRKHYICSGYRSHFKFDNGLETDGILKFQQHRLQLGETIQADLRLINNSKKLESGLAFKFFEGSKAVGSGIIF